MAKKVDVYICGVVDSLCTGSVKKVSNGIGKARKAHMSGKEAFRCKARSLLSQGYAQLDSRAFSPPDGVGPIVVLSRPSKYGCRLRPGKEGRYMPIQKTGGLIIDG